MSMDGRLALVTGGSRGIGAAVALELARKGADVVLNYHRDQQAARKVASDISQIGRRAEVYRADVADDGQVNRMLEVVRRDMGEVDILVNNAGVHRGGRIHQVPPEEFALVMDTSVKGAFNCSRLVVPGMMERGWGHVVNVTSVIGLRGWPGDTAYSSAKAAMVGFTKSLAREVASRGVLVNAVAAGYITTDMTRSITEHARNRMLKLIPLKRPGLPEEVAKVVVFMVSENTYMTGEVVQVDGGMAM
jgi:3-oxoacyl-[acyl-carrier protein] reductase